jgi:hypothetical protein
MDLWRPTHLPHHPSFGLNLRSLDFTPRTLLTCDPDDIYKTLTWKYIYVKVGEAVDSTQVHKDSSRFYLLWYLCVAQYQILQPYSPSTLWGIILAYFWKNAYARNPAHRRHLFSSNHYHILFFVSFLVWLAVGTKVQWHSVASRTVPRLHDTIQIRKVSGKTRTIWVVRFGL